MSEYQEDFNKIFRLECELLGPLEIQGDSSLQLNCQYLTVYGDHPLYEKFGSVITNKKIVFVFKSVKFCSEMKIIPCEQEVPTNKVISLPKIMSTKQNFTDSLNKYDMSDFLIFNLYDNIEKAWILEGYIEAASFSLIVE
jgi:hypothetical protein